MGGYWFGKRVKNIPPCGAGHGTRLCLQCAAVARIHPFKTHSNMSSFLESLSVLSWQVSPPPPDAEVPADLISRYGQLPAELKTFLSSFSLCVCPSDKAWFVSTADLINNQPFRFNAFELMSLEAAGSDVDWCAAIRSFWQSHFPLFLSVNDSYQYFAYCLEGPLRGQVVYGSEPEFEECSVVATSLVDFLTMFAAAARSSAPAYPFSVAIPRSAG